MSSDSGPDVEDDDSRFVRLLGAAPGECFTSLMRFIEIPNECVGAPIASGGAQIALLP